jgi:hypothetical protein
MLMSDVYHDEFRDLAKGLACARSAASRANRRGRFIPHGIDVEKRRRIPKAIVETTSPRILSSARKRGSETMALEK